MAREVGRGESLRGPVVEVTGLAREPNCRAAKSDQKRGEVSPEQEQSGEIAGYGDFAGKEHRNRKDSGRRNADARTGRRTETSVRLRRSGLNWEYLSAKHARHLAHTQPRLTGVAGRKSTASLQNKHNAISRLLL